MIGVAGATNPSFAPSRRPSFFCFFFATCRGGAAEFHADVRRCRRDSCTVAVRRVDPGNLDKAGVPIVLYYSLHEPTTGGHVTRPSAPGASVMATQSGYAHVGTSSAREKSVRVHFESGLFPVPPAMTSISVALGQVAGGPVMNALSSNVWKFSTPEECTTSHCDIVAVVQGEASGWSEELSVSWSATATECSQPAPIDGTTLSCSHARYTGHHLPGDTCTFTCINGGQHGKGVSMTSYCNSKGAWENLDALACPTEACGTPPPAPPEVRAPACTGHNAGDWCDYECGGGLAGKQRIVCTAAGAWEPLTLRCIDADFDCRPGKPVAASGSAWSAYSTCPTVWLRTLQPCWRSLFLFVC